MKRGKRFVSLALALAMICSLMVNAGATEAQEEIKAQLSYDITVSYNGETQALTDAAGNIVYPISFNGTTYLPVRAVSYVLGIAVDWDGATQTVQLSDGEAAAPKAVPVSDAPSGSKDVTAQLNPGITVKYSGEVQTMTDAAGNTVYPVSYNGTTYLPVRAVSNMLGVAVDWDGTTQTVLLSTIKGDDTTTNNKPADIAITSSNPDEVRAMLEANGFDDSAIASILAHIDNASPDNPLIIHLNGNSGNGNDFDDGLLDRFETSADANVLGDSYIGYDWAEIDWSTANDGYVRVKWTENVVDHAVCTVYWVEDGKLQQRNWYLNIDQCLGKWMKVPLTAGSRDYAVIVEMLYFDDDINENMTDEEADAIWREHLCTKFSANITDPDAWMLLSSVKADYENAPIACAKALELAKNCTTDAEKITEIFNYVAKLITYDKALYNSEKDRVAKGESQLAVNGGRNLNPDFIMTSKKGVCEHYATLMVAMLRSVGVPCRMVHGTMKLSDGTTDGHAWVAVKPETGKLNMTALGAGMEPDGEWIRLDPTNGLKAPKTTMNDNNYHVSYYE
ncbi:MAG: hypothetical protein HDT15_02340 [Oscillibacter sp.]|nr:hypothetical protein [Oscillibacter sp.]